MDRSESVRMLGEWLFDGPDEMLPEPIREWRSEALKEAPAEERKKEILESAAELFLEQTVAVKKLEWPRDDDEQSTKFFKVSVASYPSPRVISTLLISLSSTN